MIPSKINLEVRNDIDMDKIASAAAWAMPVLGAIGGGVAGYNLGPNKLKGTLVGAGAGALGGVALRGAQHGLGLTESAKDVSKLETLTKTAPSEFLSRAGTGLSHDVSSKARALTTNPLAREIVKKEKLLGGIIGNEQQIVDLSRSGRTAKDIAYELNKSPLVRMKDSINPTQLALAGGGTYLAGEYLGKKKTEVKL